MRKWLPLLTVCLGTFMLIVDVTVVNVALPDMVTDLRASFGALQWVVDAYALVLAALLLGAGAVADRVGHRRAYLAGLAVFAVSSLVCGVAGGPGMLIAARATQGVGGALMFATTFALLNSAYTGQDRAGAYGMWGAVTGASSAIGPILGGVLTQGISWRWIFFVNLPVTAVAVVLCLTAMADAHAPHRGRIDVPGIVTFSAAAGALTYALIRANERGWGDSAVLELLVAAAVLLAGFVGVEARSRNALFDLALLRERAFVGVLMAGLLLTFAAFAPFTYAMIWLQSVLGLGPIAAGLTALPMSVVAFTVSAVFGRALHTWPAGRVIGWGLLAVAAGSALTAALTHGAASWPALLPGNALVGVGIGMIIPILGSASLALVPPQRGGMAAGAVNTTRQLGYAVGIATLGSAFTARAASVLTGPHPAVAARAIAGGRAASLPAAEQVVRAGAVAGVQAVFLAAAAAALLASLLAFTLMRPRGADAQARSDVDSQASIPA